jgi:hypothetical protein
MTSSDDRAAFDAQVLEVYLDGLRVELESKLRDLRRLQQTLQDLRQGHDAQARIGTVRALAEQFDRMLVTNRVVRETLLQLRDTAHLLMRELQNSRTSQDT